MKCLRESILILFLSLSVCSLSAHGSANFYQAEVIAQGLDHPWSIAFVSNDELLVTELSGQLRLIKDGVLLPDPIDGVPEVYFAGQAGLSEVRLHPKFSENQILYLSFSSSNTSAPKSNQLEVVRAQLEDRELVNVETVFKSYPLRTTAAHYGARIRFLHDGTMLITSGDGFNFREKAQELDNHFGKVIRINDDGTIPKDNPFLATPGAMPEIWSYGHRNPQGLVIASDGTVFEHEHGPKGGDEINIISPGKNYGWPAITYGVDYSGATISPFTEKDGMEQPLKHWVPSIAPSGMILYRGEEFPQWQGNLLLSALVPGDVRRLEMDGRDIIKEEVLFTEFGRIRDIAEAPDGSLILATDGDDAKLIRITAAK